MAKMDMFLNNMKLPAVPLGGLTRVHVSNDADKRTLRGKLTTDFRSRSEAWVLSYGYLVDDTDIQNIMVVYDLQYSTRVYPTFRFDHYQIEKQVKIDISDRQISHNGVLLSGLKLTLTEIEPLVLIS